MQTKRTKDHEQATNKGVSVQRTPTQMNINGLKVDSPPLCFAHFTPSSKLLLIRFLTGSVLPKAAVKLKKAILVGNPHSKYSSKENCHFWNVLLITRQILIMSQSQHASLSCLRALHHVMARIYPQISDFKDMKKSEEHQPLVTVSKNHPKKEFSLPKSTNPVSN